MSYAGTYGDDETCRHDCYWRSCAYCSGIGPKATEGQIDAYFAKREKEIQRSREEESERRAAYARLSADERKVAAALWQLTTGPRNGVDLQEAVEDSLDMDLGSSSGFVNMARKVCGQAKAAVAALKA